MAHWIKLYKGKRYTRPAKFFAAIVKDDLLVTYKSSRGTQGIKEFKVCDTYHHSFGELKSLVRDLMTRGYKVIIPKEKRKVDFETGEVTMQVPSNEELSALFEEARLVTEASQFDWKADQSNMENQRSTVRQEIEAAWDQLWLEPLAGDANVNDIQIGGKEEFISRLEKYLSVKVEAQEPEVPGKLDIWRAEQ